MDSIVKSKSLLVGDMNQTNWKHYITREKRASTRFSYKT
jgi:ribosomal protein S9